MRGLLQFWASHRAEVAVLLMQHIVLGAVATTVAVATGVPLGIFAARRPRLAAPAMAIAGVVQTIPSLAMFGFLLPVPLIGGVGARAALVVLILYGLLPIVRMTIAGLRAIDPAIREAGVAMGMTPRELLRQAELPPALPSVVAGIRVAAVVGEEGAKRCSGGPPTDSRRIFVLRWGVVGRHHGRLRRVRGPGAARVVPSAGGDRSLGGVHRRPRPLRTHRPRGAPAARLQQQ